MPFVLPCLAFIAVANGVQMLHTYQMPQSHGNGSLLEQLASLRRETEKLRAENAEIRRGLHRENLGMDETRSLTKFAMRVFGDTLPKADAGSMLIYAFSYPDDQIESVASRTARTHFETGSPILLFEIDNACLAKPIPGWSGTGFFWRLLEEKHGVPPSALRRRPWRSTVIQTLVEAEAVARAARDLGTASLIVIAIPVHVPRAMLTTLSVVTREFERLAVHVVSGAPQAWNERAGHSQGMVAIRADLLDHEFNRIALYTAKGDLIKADFALEILRRRDAPRTSSLHIGR